MAEAATEQDLVMTKIKKSWTTSSTEDNTKFYDNWAKDYDKDFRGVEYVATEIGAKTLAKFLDKLQIGTNCKILDVGSGTGLVGEHLRELKYTHVDALEPSERSNDIARSKGLYKMFIVEKLEPGKQVSIPSDTYDAAISIGAFIPGHISAVGMDEMARVVRSGGLVCFSFRDDLVFKDEYDYEKKMAQLCKSNTWKLLSKTTEPHFVNKHCCMFVYQVL